jgi:DNA-binding transcriptional regulator/RsmH inhibitor MraZ
VTVHRLSPKNQVTIPREARVFAVGGAKLEHLRARPHVVRKPGSGEEFPTVVLMSEAELQERERRIAADTELSVDEKFAYVTRMNDEMKMLAIDAQNRVVLPAECVAHIGVGDSREVKFVCTNTVIQIWNPEQYQRFAGTGAKPAYDAMLAKYLSL